MLSAMDASTGGPGTCTNPSVAAGQRETMRGRERGDRADQAPGTIHQQHKSEHEEQMIEPAQDVLDAQHRVRCDHLEPAGTRTSHEAWTHRDHALELDAAVQAHQPREHVDSRFREVREHDGLSVEPARYADAPPLHRDAARERAPHVRERRGAGWKLWSHLECRGLVNRGDLPKDVCTSRRPPGSAASTPA